VSELTYLGAIREALIEEMERDPRVFLIGEDIGHFGGAFKVTEGLLERFGAARVVDTPIAEALIVGVSIGAAIRGQRPVAEMQFADFVTCGFSQLVENAGTFHYRLKVSVPMVIRLPSGGGVGGGPYHSRNTEAWFAHASGLKVVAPATPSDAKGLLKTAIRDPDPVVYLEQKWLYRREKEQVPDGEHLVPFGQARIAREGRHATVVAYANAVPMAVEAADRLAKDGVSVEVIDLRTLVPWDWRTVLASVQKTGRLLVATEASRTASFASEVAATVAELAVAELDAPILRVSAPDTPVPAEKGLEAFHRPNTERIVEALRALTRY
jgi:2-oxoisovalerate dehydrogenase E1 component beta subunit